MANAAAWGIEAEHFDRAKGLLVELDGLGGVVDGQVGRDAVLAFGDGFDCHVRLSCAMGAEGALLLRVVRTDGKSTVTLDRLSISAAVRRCSRWSGSSTGGCG
jgi:hypothetical protein